MQVLAQQHTAQKMCSGRLPTLGASVVVSEETKFGQDQYCMSSGFLDILWTRQMVKQQAAAPAIWQTIEVEDLRTNFYTCMTSLEVPTEHPVALCMTNYNALCYRFQ